MPESVPDELPPAPELAPATSPPPIPPPAPPEPEPAPPPKPRGAVVGGGLAIGGGATALVGVVVGAVGGIGWLWAQECNFICPGGDGTAGKAAFITGASIAGVGLIVGTTGLVVRSSALGKTATITPVLGPRMVGVGLGMSF